MGVENSWTVDEGHTPEDLVSLGVLRKGMKVYHDNLECSDIMKTT